jgi:cardiolipin synthase
VHVDFFIVAWDDTTRGFFSAMERAVARGVTVRLLADHLPSAKIPGSKETFAELDRIGVKWSWMLPVQIFKGKYQRPRPAQSPQAGRGRRTRRIHGIAEPHRANLRLPEEHQARSAVAGADDPAHRARWSRGEHRLPVGLVHRDRRATHRARAGERDRRTRPRPTPCCARSCPADPGYTTENNLRMFLSLIYGATEKVIITSPYFVPDEAMVYAITTACQRGLEVQLFVSEQADQWLVGHAQRSYYSDLLEAGVRIFMYPAPYILHAKHMSIDDDIAFIGSSNMDIRSFSLNAESSLLVRGASFVDGMREVEQGYRDAGRELTLEAVAKRAAQGHVLRRSGETHVGGQLTYSWRTVARHAQSHPIRMTPHGAVGR